MDVLRPGVRRTPGRIILPTACGRLNRLHRPARSRPCRATRRRASARGLAGCKCGIPSYTADTIIRR